MSIASELTALNGYILGAYDEINTKGGTVPVNKNMANLASAIVSIPSGGGGIGIPMEVDSQGMYQKPTSSFTFSLPSNATSLGTRALYSTFYGCTGLTAADLSSLTTVSGASSLQYAFSGCTSLTSVDLSSLTTVSTGTYIMNNMCYGCTSLTSVDLSSLTTVSGNYGLQYAFSGCTNLTSVDLSALTTLSATNAMQVIFQNCTSLTSVDLSSLTTVSGSRAAGTMFSGCTGLTTFTFPSLSVLTGAYALQSCFSGCTNLRSVYFPALTASSFGSTTSNNQFSGMLQNCSNVTVHFPSIVKSVIQNWTDVTNKFGGTSVTVLYDL